VWRETATSPSPARLGLPDAPLLPPHPCTSLSGAAGELAVRRLASGGRLRRAGRRRSSSALSGADGGGRTGSSSAAGPWPPPSTARSGGDLHFFLPPPCAPELGRGLAARRAELPSSRAARCGRRAGAGKPPSRRGGLLPAPGEVREARRGAAPARFQRVFFLFQLPACWCGRQQV